MQTIHCGEFFVSPEKATSELVIPNAMKKRFDVAMAFYRCLIALLHRTAVWTTARCDRLLERRLTLR